MSAYIELIDGRLIEREVINEIYACYNGELKGELFEYPKLLWGLTHLGGFILEVSLEVDKQSMKDACGYIIQWLEGEEDAY
jgi:hypothetical protein